MKRGLPFLLLFALAGFPFFLPAQDTLAPPIVRWEDSARTIFNLIYRDTARLPKIVIETDLPQLIRLKSKKTYQPAEVSFSAGNGNTYRWPIKLRSRGNRRKEVCYFPPVKLNFDKDGLKDQGFLLFDKIELVNQCRTENRANEDYLIKEYLAYRIYNVLTEQSFRARLVQLVYLDTSHPGKQTEMLGLVLEPEEELAARLNGVVVEQEKTYSTHIDTSSFHLMNLFQYMIGNTDWAIGNRHNILTVKLPQIRKLTAVPYDFDYCGMVAPPYAVPNEALPIKNVRDRYNNGGTMSEEELNRLIAHFNERRPELTAVCTSVAHVSTRAGQEALNYLAYFFQMLDNTRKLESIFVKGNQ